MPSWWVRKANSSIWVVAGTSALVQRMSFTHLIQEQPYHPGTTNRTGAPCSAVSGWPFMRTARKGAVRAIWSSDNTQLAPGKERPEADASWSMPAMTTAVASAGFGTWSSTRLSGTPSHATALISPKFCGLALPAHSIRCTPIGRASAASAAAVSAIGGAAPWVGTARRHDAGS